MAEKMMDDESLSPYLDIFQTPPKGSGIQAVQWIDYHPVSDINHGPLEFSIPAAGSQYLDLSRTELYLKLRLEKQGKGIEAPEDVTPINLTLHTIFSQLDVSLQQKMLYNSGRYYPYRAYIDTLLNYNNTSERGLPAEMFYPDTSGAMDSYVAKLKPNTDFNTGLLQRYNRVKEGNYIELMGPLHSDLCKLEKLLPNGVNIGIKLHRANTAFSLMAGAIYASIYKIHIAEAVLKVCKVTLEPEIFTAHSNVMEMGITAKYPLKKTEISTFIVPSGATAWAQHDIFQNRIPLRVVVGLVAATAFVGDFKRNPFNFQGYDLSSLSVTQDGQALPYAPLKMNFEEGACVEAYTKLFNRKKGEQDTQELLMTDFLNGYALYVYELDAKFYHPGCSMQTRAGSLGIEAIFDKPLPENVNIVIYAQFDGLLEIDQFRAVKM
jgi:hypothetical protein